MLLHLKILGSDFLLNDECYIWYDLLFVCIQKLFIYILKEEAGGSRWEGEDSVKSYLFIYEGRDRREPVGGGSWCKNFLFIFEERGRREPVGGKVELYKLVWYLSM